MQFPSKVFTVIPNFGEDIIVCIELIEWIEQDAACC
jgi:hypothetical protein